MINDKDDFDAMWNIDVPFSESEETDDFDESWGNLEYLELKEFECEDIDAAIARNEKKCAHRKFLENYEDFRMEQEGWLRIIKYECHLVPGDTIRYTEDVWGENFHDKEFLGTRTNTVNVIRETYSKELSHRIYFTVIQSSGKEPFEKGKQTWRKDESFFRYKCYRRHWDDESLREKTVSECKKLREELREERYNKLGDSFDLESDPTCPASNKKGYDDDKFDYVEQLSEEEQHWVDSEWHIDVDRNIFPDDKRHHFVFDADWKPLSTTNDEAVVGDIVRFSSPDFTGRYPKTKYIGNSILIAEVVKIGRQYYHLRLLAYKGNSPRCKSHDMFRKQFYNVYTYGAYRLPWRCESMRWHHFSKQTNIMFMSFEEYIEYTEAEVPEDD